MQTLCDTINDYRESIGCSRLVLAKELCDLADIRCDELTVYFDHDRPNGESGPDIIKETNLDCKNFGENILEGDGSFTADEMLAAWLQSPAHKAAIEDNRYTHTGISVQEKNGMTYAIQFFYE